MRSCLPQSAATLGVHVGSFVRHLSQPEVADMVEGASTNRSFGMALSSLSSGLAGNGCRGFLGCESARSAASAHDLAVGDLRNDSRCDTALGRGAIHSARRTPSTRVGGNVGSDSAASLRHLPNRRARCGKALASMQKPSCLRHFAPHPLASFGESDGTSGSVSFPMS